MGQLQRSTFPHRRTALGLIAGVTSAALLVVPAAAAPPDDASEGLPGSGTLSTAAVLRPADLTDAEKQFVDRVPQRYREQELQWAACPADWLEFELPPDLSLDCAAVAVPMDWSDPEKGEPLRIAVSRLPREGTRPERTIITNPGGPGGSGLLMPLYLASQEALAGTEVIGLDVRGTGASSTIQCDFASLADEPPLPDPRNRSAEALDATAGGMAALAEACQRGGGTLGRFVNTEQTVQDIDLVRALLGRATIDWLGWSAGTWLGAQYMTYFPARTSRFVLDSSVDVTGPWQRSGVRQAIGFQRRLEVDFAPWAARHHDRYRLGVTPAEVSASYESLRATYRARPLFIPALDLVVDGTTIDNAVAQSMYSKRSFEPLAETLLQLRVIADLRTWTEPGALDRLLDELAELLVEVLPPDPAPDDSEIPDHEVTFESTFLTTLCNDTSARGRDWVEDVSTQLGPRFPLLAWGLVQDHCVSWDRPPLQLPTPDGADLPPVLMIQSERDPATPIEGALLTHAALPSSRLVTVRDEGDHALYASAGNPCVDEKVDTFLTTGVIPDEDTTCETTGIPEPGSVSAEPGGTTAALSDLTIRTIGR